MGFIGWINDIFDRIWTTLTDVWNALLKLWSDFLSYIHSVLSQVWERIDYVASLVGANVDSILSLVWEKIDFVLKFINDVIVGVQKNLSTIWWNTIGLLVEQWNKFIAYLDKWWEGGMAWVHSAISNAIELLRKVLTVMLGDEAIRIDTSVSDLKKWIEEKWDTLTEAVFSIFEGWVDEFNTGFDRGLEAEVTE